MLNDNSHFIARSPRHSATGVASLRITFQRIPIEKQSEKPPAHVEVELVDLSRSGIQFRTTAALINGERIRIEIEDVSTGFRSSQEAVVRWQRSAGDRHWLTGGRFVEELSWEVLGELFLTDALSRDVLKPPQS